MNVDPQDLALVLRQIERHFHALIKARAAELDLPLPTALPALAGVPESADRPAWFAVPGMYGGFAYWLDRSASEPTLVAESWSRVIEGSGRRHAVTAAGATLVDEGFA